MTFELAAAGFGVLIEHGPVHKLYLLLLAPLEQCQTGPKQRSTTESSKTSNQAVSRWIKWSPGWFWSGLEEAPGGH
jgi:hypothetical protein